MSKDEDEPSNPPEPLNIAISLVTDAFRYNSTALDPKEIVLEGDDFPDPWDILLDSQCQDHIFQNHSLLHGIHSTDEMMTIKGQVNPKSSFLSELPKKNIFLSSCPCQSPLSLKSTRRMAYELCDKASEELQGTWLIAPDCRRRTAFWTEGYPTFG
jgi:hypothetical protein